MAPPGVVLSIEFAGSDLPGRRPTVGHASAEAWLEQGLRALHDANPRRQRIVAMLTSAIDLTFTAVEESMIRSRSRKRLDLTRPVEPELILECIEIAMQSPTGTNQQNWSFVVVTDADKRAAIATGTVGPAR